MLNCKHSRSSPIFIVLTIQTNKTKLLQAVLVDNHRNEPPMYPLLTFLMFIQMCMCPSPVEVAHPLKRAHAALCKDAKDKSVSHNGRVKTSKVKQMLACI